MSAEMQNGRAATEVTTPPVVDAQALIPRADTAKDSALVSPEQAQRHSLEAVGVGIERFLADFRASLGTDVEAEMTELGLCKTCGLYPAAWMQRCFSCNAKMRLPSC